MILRALRIIGGVAVGALILSLGFWMLLFIQNAAALFTRYH